MSKNSKKKRLVEEARRNAWMKRHVPRNGTDPKDTESRQHLLYENEVNVGMAIEQAAQQGEKNPVVFVIDCRDKVGYAIAAGWLGEETVKSHITNISPSGSIPTVTLAIPHRTAVQLLKTMECSPLAQSKFSELPPDGRVNVVVVAAGGNLFVQVKSPQAGDEQGKDTEGEMERLTIQEFYVRFRPKGYGEITFDNGPPEQFTEVICDLCSALIAHDQHDSGIVYVVGDSGVCEKCANKIQWQEEQQRQPDDGGVELVFANPPFDDFSRCPQCHDTGFDGDFCYACGYGG